jgi:hypothetical protein
VPGASGICFEPTRELRLAFYITEEIHKKKIFSGILRCFLNVYLLPLALSSQYDGAANSGDISEK